MVFGAWFAGLVLGFAVDLDQRLLPDEVTDIHQVTQVSGGGSQVIVIGPQLPTVTGVSPIEGSPAGGTHVTITGTGFVGATEVHFGENAATEFTIESGTTIHAVAPAGTGTVAVTVTIAGGTSAPTPASDFSYAPIVTSVAPTSGSQEGGTKVVIHGSNCQGWVTTSLMLSPHRPLSVRLRMTWATALLPTSGSPEASKAIVLIM